MTRKKYSSIFTKEGIEQRTKGHEKSIFVVMCILLVMGMIFLFLKKSHHSKIQKEKQTTGIQNKLIDSFKVKYTPSASSKIMDAYDIYQDLERLEEDIENERNSILRDSTNVDSTAGKRSKASLEKLNKKLNNLLDEEH